MALGPVRSRINADPVPFTHMDYPTPGGINAVAFHAAEKMNSSLGMTKLARGLFALGSRPTSLNLTPVLQGFTRALNRQATPTRTLR